MSQTLIWSSDKIPSFYIADSTRSVYQARLLLFISQNTAYPKAINASTTALHFTKTKQNKTKPNTLMQTPSSSLYKKRNKTKPNTLMQTPRDL